MSKIPTSIDVAIIGGGAAGLFCGAQAGQRGLSVAVFEHSAKPAEKVRISGGGRCNFTNLGTAPKAFISQNPHFCKSALARYTPSDFLDQMRRHSLGWNDKGLGQLFCDERSGAIIDMLLEELKIGGGELYLQTSVASVTQTPDGFHLVTSEGSLSAKQVVIATGGLSIPKIGATSFAYDIARQFGHEIVPTRPALVPLTFSEPYKDDFAALAGVALPTRATAGGMSFDEAMLFTHRGLSGPAILQISSYWQEGTPIELDVLGPGTADTALSDLKRSVPQKSLKVAAESIWPKRFTEYATSASLLPTVAKLAEAPDRILDTAASKLRSWKILPTGTEGYRTAEVTLGGVSTDFLSSKTMASRHAPGLYFIGEAVDVTGWLGGYNFQWAWASAHAAAEAMADVHFS